MINKLNWQNDLGAPALPCTVQLHEGGLVDVEEGDIDRARRLRGRAVFDVEALNKPSPLGRFFLGAAEGV